MNSSKRSDVTVRFIDENNKELGRDYFVAPLGQCKCPCDVLSPYFTFYLLPNHIANLPPHIASCLLHISFSGTVTGYGNIKTITPRGGKNVYMVASCDLCGRGNGANSLTSVQMATNGQVTDCF